MAVRLGKSDTSSEEPGVQLLIALRPEARREEALANDADLVLDLPLLPARGGRAGDQFDQIVPVENSGAELTVQFLDDVAEETWRRASTRVGARNLRMQCCPSSEARCPDSGERGTMYTISVPLVADER